MASLSARLVVAALVSLGSLHAAASTPEQEQAAARFADAEALFRVGEYEAALTAYKESYLLSREPGLLFNMAQCLFLLQRYEEARRSYQLYLQDEPESTLRIAVEARITEIDALLAASKAPPQRAPRDRLAGLWWGAGLAGVGLGLGGATLFLDRRLVREEDPAATPPLRAARAVTALSSDVFFLSAVVVPAVWWLATRTPQEAP